MCVERCGSCLIETLDNLVSIIRGENTNCSHLMFKFKNREKNSSLTITLYFSQVQRLSRSKVFVSKNENYNDRIFIPQITVRNDVFSLFTIESIASIKFTDERNFIHWEIVHRDVVSKFMYVAGWLDLRFRAGGQAGVLADGLFTE